MYQNYVVEIKKFHNGEFEHNVSWFWDENATIAEQKAFAKFHETLARAAISNTAEHAAIVFSSEGFPLDHKCFKHDPIPEETPDVEPEE